MAKCNRETHPNLFAYLEAYGLDQHIIDRIDRIKGNSESAYYVVGAPRGDGTIEIFDLSNTPDKIGIDYRDQSSMNQYGWNMLNEGMPSITEKDWNRIKIWPHCEGFSIPGHKDYE